MQDAHMVLNPLDDSFALDDCPLLSNESGLTTKRYQHEIRCLQDLANMTKLDTASRS